MENNIKNIMAVVFSVNPKMIDDSFTPQTTEIWDSIHHMNLIVALEEEFNVEFDEYEITEMLSLSKIKEIISTKLQNKNKA